MAGQFIVRPIGRLQAEEICRRHPHAQTLPKDGKYHMMLTVGGKEAGLAVWGYGLRPRRTPKHLFGDEGKVEEYLELCRFFVYDWCPRNTASRFLVTTHRILRHYSVSTKWLYTYAAGFQGMIGHIYKAAGYEYLGRVKCDAFLYVLGRGMVHQISLYHRYGLGSVKASDWQDRFPGSVQWAGYNFRYLY